MSSRTKRGKTEALGPTAAVLIAILSLGRSAVAYQPVTPDLARVYHIFLSGKARMTVKDALDGAVRRLAKPRCQQVFEQFTDQEGRTLTANLAAVGKTGADFLADLYFVDGDETIQCRTDDTIAAFTVSGSRVIHVCGTRFAERFARNTKGGEMVLIHELLHTLGLGEDPPTSAQIGNAVRARCGS